MDEAFALCKHDILNGKWHLMTPYIRSSSPTLISEMRILDNAEHFSSYIWYEGLWRLFKISFCWWGAVCLSLLWGSLRCFLLTLKCSCKHVLFILWILYHMDIYLWINTIRHVLLLFRTSEKSSVAIIPTGRRSQLTISAESADPKASPHRMMAQLILFYAFDW